MDIDSKFALHKIVCTNIFKWTSRLQHDENDLSDYIFFSKEFLFKITI